MPCLDLASSYRAPPRLHGPGTPLSPPRPGEHPSRTRDARAAMSQLARTAGIDPNRIGILGFSQGAWVALLAANDNPGPTLASDATSTPNADAALVFLTGELTLTAANGVGTATTNVDTTAVSMAM